MLSDYLQAKKLPWVLLGIIGGAGIIALAVLIHYAVVYGGVIKRHMQSHKWALPSAELPALAYTSPLEELGEKFYVSPALLKELNPSGEFKAGETIRVPNIQAGDQPAETQTQAQSQPAAGVVKLVVSPESTERRNRARSDTPSRTAASVSPTGMH